MWERWCSCLQHKKKHLLGAISLSEKIAYHLFTVDTNSVNIKESVKLIRKSKWQSQYGRQKCKFDILQIWILSKQ